MFRLSRGLPLVLFALAALLPVLLPARGVAQLDLYRRITDPLAIADLAAPDAELLKSATGIYAPPIFDKATGYNILAQDTGSGIITHIWSAYAKGDTSELQLWVDNQLLYKGNYRSFFLTPKAQFRSPFDTIVSAGLVSRTQIPYRNGFKILFKPDPEIIFYVIKWRPLELSRVASAAQEFMSGSNADDVEKAAKSYWACQMPLPPLTELTISRTLDTGLLTLAGIAGPGVIREIALLPQNASRRLLDSLDLVIHYNDFPEASVDVPLADLFSIDRDYRKYRSFYSEVDSAGRLLLRFPMPFQHRCRVSLRNRLKRPVKLTGWIKHGKYTPDWKNTGYFHSKLSVSNPTLIDVVHPVLNVKGRGRYVGMLLRVENASELGHLEGNAIFHVDSSAAHSFEYTGTEDYFDAAFYFAGGPFRLPFAGMRDWTTFYRYHALDAMDFKSYLTVEQGHGYSNEYTHECRSVGLYYKEWDGVFVDRDTIRAGERWHIKLYGQGIGVPIRLSLGETTIASIVTGATGAVSFTVDVQAGWKPGRYWLHLNGHRTAKEIVIAEAPTLTYRKARVRPFVQPLEVLSVYGVGFRTGEAVSIYLGDSLCSTAIADTAYRIAAEIAVPFMKAGKSVLRATGESGDTVLADRVVTVDRSLRYELELLIDSTSLRAYKRMLAFWYARWSDHRVCYFVPDTAIRTLTLAIPVDDAGEYDVRLGLTTGRQYGDYLVSFDSDYYALFNGYGVDWPHPSDTIELGRMRLDSGMHSLRFEYIGRDPRNVDSALAADYLILTPIRKPEEPLLDAEPARAHTAALRLSRDAVTQRTFVHVSEDEACELSVYDVIGRELKRFRARGSTEVPTAGLPRGVYWIAAPGQGKLARFFVR